MQARYFLQDFAGHLSWYTMRLIVQNKTQEEESQILSCEAGLLANLRNAS